MRRICEINQILLPKRVNISIMVLQIGQIEFFPRFLTLFCQRIHLICWPLFAHILLWRSTENISWLLPLRVSIIDHFEQTFAICAIWGIYKIGSQRSGRRSSPMLQPFKLIKSSRLHSRRSKSVRLLLLHTSIRVSFSQIGKHSSFGTISDLGSTAIILTIFKLIHNIGERSLLSLGRRMGMRIVKGLSLRFKV